MLQRSDGSPSIGVQQHERPLLILQSLSNGTIGILQSFPDPLTQHQIWLGAGTIRKPGAKSQQDTGDLRIL